MRAGKCLEAGWFLTFWAYSSFSTLLFAISIYQNKTFLLNYPLVLVWKSKSKST